MKILITGGTGFIGQRLGAQLHRAGHELVVVSRNLLKAQRAISYEASFIECDLQTTALTKNDFDGIDAIINLIGETIDGRWTSTKKNEILKSRTLSAENLLKNCPSDLKTIVATSAQGYYGDTANLIVDESSPAGVGFLAEVCKLWEQPFVDWQKKSKTRVAIIRVGIVLNRGGGALKKLISLFEKNLGAQLGSGQQWMSFISLEDLCKVYQNAVENEVYQGVINAVTPEPVQNKEFTEKLCQGLKVFQLPSVPGFVLKALLGEMSVLALGSTRVKPTQLLKLNFQFKQPKIDDVFATELQ